MDKDRSIDESPISSQEGGLNEQNQSKQDQIMRNRWDEILAMAVPDYCLFLKQYRLKFKPPIIDQPSKTQFCAYFDGVLLKKSVDEVTKAIQAQMKRKSSQEKAVEKPIVSEPLHNQWEWVQKIDKVLLYSWQLSNIRTILGSESASICMIAQETINSLHRLCISTSRIYVCGWGLKHVTMQAMQICYFNLLKNRIFDVDPVKNGSLCCLIEAILADTDGNDHHQFINIDREFSLMFANQEQEPIRKNSKQITKQEIEKGQTQPQKPSAKIMKKTSTELQLEWFTYIIEHCISHCDTFIRQTYCQLSNNKIHSPTPSSISFLHYITVLLNKIINDRTTTEIVKGYSCPIEDVKRMYSRANGAENVGAAVEIKISWVDYEWLLQVLLPQMWRKYKGEILLLWDRQVLGKNVSTREYFSHYIYCIMNIISVVNCCNFLGGYCPQLQKKTTNMVMEKGLEFLQLSYLIYELCHAKKKNIELKTYETQQASFVTNLSLILNEGSKETKPHKNNFSIQLIQVPQPQIKLDKVLTNILPLEEGQLVSIIRMFSNLVHINETAQKYFEDNIKYFRIIMSLTHEFESQLTMKNWAIVFLRNVAERSAIMRAELEKLQIDVKVDNGSSPFM